MFEFTTVCLLLTITSFEFVLTKTPRATSELSSTNQTTNLNVVTHYINVTRPVRGAFLALNTATQKREEVDGSEKPSRNRLSLASLPRFSLSKSQHIKMDPKVYQCNIPDDLTCMNKTTQFKERILTELKRVRETYVEESNFYNIDYKSRKTNTTPICLVINSKVQVLRKTKAPFSSNLLGTLFPKQKLLAHYRGDNKSCVIVSSAGSMKKSNLGEFIGE